jgi:hypothetical protein
MAKIKNSEKLYKKKIGQEQAWDCAFGLFP